jgi:hypothetical protein
MGARNLSLFAARSVLVDLSAADADVSGCIGLLVEGAGNVSVLYNDAAATPDIFNGVPAYYRLDGMFKMVVRATTTATRIHALY